MVKVNSDVMHFIMKAAGISLDDWEWLACAEKPMTLWKSRHLVPGLYPVMKEISTLIFSNVEHFQNSFIRGLLAVLQSLRLQFERVSIIVMQVFIVHSGSQEISSRRVRKETDGGLSVMD